MYPFIQLLTKKCWSITALILTAITALSLIPLPALPDAPSSDKAYHLIAYSLLSLPIAIRGGRRWMLLLPCFILWGGAIELIQPYVNRYGGWLDFSANLSGVAIGAGAGILARRLCD